MLSVEDDVGLMREYVDKVAPGTTRFIVTVLAFMWLWSGHDVFLEHVRRYTLGPHRRTRVLFLRRRAASRCPFARGGTIDEARS